MRAHYFLVFVIFLTSVAMADPTGTVFTANEDGLSISQFNLDTNQLVTLPVTIAPHNIQISNNQKMLLASGMQHMDMPMPNNTSHNMKAEGQLVIFDLPLSETPKLIIAIPGHPAHVVTSPDDQFAYVSDSTADAVHVIDLAKGKIISTIKTGKYPHGLRLNKAGSFLYVANMQDNSISEIDTKTLTENKRLPVGKTPVQVALTPDDKVLYVSLSAENKVGVIDLTTQKLINKISVNDKPIQLFATPDGKEVYAANQGTLQHPDNRVSVIDTQTQTVTHTIKTDKGAHGVVISSNGQYVFVTNTKANTFSVIDAASHKLIASHQVGDGPNGITYTKESY